MVAVPHDELAAELHEARLLVLVAVVELRRLVEIPDVVADPSVRQPLMYGLDVHAGNLEKLGLPRRSSGRFLAPLHARANHRVELLADWLDVRIDMLTISAVLHASGTSEQRNGCESIRGFHGSLLVGEDDSNNQNEDSCGAITGGAHDDNCCYGPKLHDLAPLAGGFVLMSEAVCTGGFE